MGASRVGVEHVKRELAVLIHQGFVHSRVPGLTANPVILIERPLNTLDEPYIYLYTEDVPDVDLTKSGNAYDYFVIAQVVTRVPQNEDSSQTRDAIVEEVTSLVDTTSDNYINLVNNGYNVYIQKVSRVDDLEKYEERGATYFQSNITIQVRADFIGLPTDNRPVQAPSFTFAGFTYMPTNNIIEWYDAGTITPATTYPSGNMGWDFVSTTNAVISGGAGSLMDGVYTITGENDPLGLVTTINYQFSTDPTLSLSPPVRDTTNFPRGVNLRFGAITADSGSQPTFLDDTSANYGLRNLSAWTAGVRQNVMLGRLDPKGIALTINVMAGEYLYVIFDANQTASVITQRTSLGDFNVTDTFEALETVGRYRYYISTTPIHYTTTITLILS